MASVSLHVYLLEQVSCLFFSFFQRDASTLLKALKFYERIQRFHLNRRKFH